MIPNRNVAGAVGGKTARPCENCLRRRARWFCPADDAFLCQACDTSVHCANPLARRHERVRLKTASFVSHIRNRPPPSWHCGFTRKARTPRHAKPAPPHHPSPNDAESQEEKTIRPLKAAAKGPHEPVVPELSADDVGTSPDENEEQLLYRVPIFDPFEATATVLNDVVKASDDAAAGSDRLPTKGLVGGGLSAASCDEDGNEDGAASGSTTDVHGTTSSFLPSEMDLAEFAADVENLLGSGLEQECFGMDELGIMEDCKDNKYSNYNSMESSPHLLIGADGSVEYTIKDEDDDVYGAPAAAAPAREPFKLGFELHSADEPAAACGGVDEKSMPGVPVGGEQMMIAVVSVGNGVRAITDNNNKGGSSKLLKLDYEAIITAWEGQGSPWTSGDRPEFNPDECWPDCMGTEVHCGPNYEEAAGGIGSRHGGAVGDVDGGREARVSRYREKRRTRLFSKKIRYEVRKLNAEKRPRMKGRFVKRASVSGHAIAPLPLNYIRK